MPDNDDSQSANRCVQHEPGDSQAPMVRRAQRVMVLYCLAGLVSGGLATWLGERWQLSVGTSVALAVGLLVVSLILATLIAALWHR